jgi:hypothetical protein
LSGQSSPPQGIDHIIASPTNNTDLYWALSGGGGGTYAVVISMTARLHEDGVIGGGYLTFDNLTVGNDAFWNAVEKFNRLLPGIQDGGTNTIAYSLINNAFSIYNLVAPGKNSTDVHAMLQPFLDDLDSLGIPYNCSTHESATFLEQLSLDYGPLPRGPFATPVCFRHGLFSRGRA